MRPWSSPSEFEIGFQLAQTLQRQGKDGRLRGLGAGLEPVNGKQLFLDPILGPADLNGCPDRMFLGIRVTFAPQDKVSILQACGGSGQTPALRWRS
jgi:hypothetical protein